MFGHLPLSQIVCSPCSLTSSFISEYLPPPAMSTFSQSGLTRFFCTILTGGLFSILFAITLCKGRSMFDYLRMTCITNLTENRFYLRIVGNFNLYFCVLP